MRQDPAQRVCELQRLVNRQADTIDRLRATRRAHIPKARKGVGRGSFVRVIIPDSHGCYVDPGAAGRLFSDLDILRPREVVFLGDHLDCGGFLAQHHTTHYVAQAEYTFEQDCEHANAFLDAVQKRTPGAVCHYLEGNHERRLETFVCTATLRNGRDAKFLRQLVSAQNVLHLKRRGIRYYPINTHHDGLRVQGAIKLGHCYFVHGISTAKHAASATLAKFGGPVVFGHTHRAESYTGELVNTDVGVIAAWCPGCLCEKSPMYLHGNPSTWTHGYAAQVVDRQGAFLHLQIPIIEGVSHLQQFLSIVGR